MSNSTATLKSTTAITPLPNRAFDPDAVRLFLKPLTPVQQGELARLDSTTKPPVLQPADVAAKAAKLVTSSRNEFGQVDNSQLAAKLANASPEALREVQKFLTPVQRGELAREISALKPPVLKPANPVVTDPSAIAAKVVAGSRDESGQIDIPQLAAKLVGAPVEIIQEVTKLLTPEQQKSFGDELLRSNLSIQNAPLQQRFGSKIGGFFKDVGDVIVDTGKDFVDFVKRTFNDVADFFKNGVLGDVLDFTLFDGTPFHGVLGEVLNITLSDGSVISGVLGDALNILRPDGTTIVWNPGDPFPTLGPIAAPPPPPPPVAPPPPPVAPPPPPPTIQEQAFDDATNAYNDVVTARKAYRENRSEETARALLFAGQNAQFSLDVAKAKGVPADKTDEIAKYKDYVSDSSDIAREFLEESAYVGLDAADQNRIDPFTQALDLKNGEFLDRLKADNNGNTEEWASALNGFADGLNDDAHFLKGFAIGVGSGFYDTAKGAVEGVESAGKFIINNPGEALQAANIALNPISSIAKYALGLDPGASWVQNLVSVAKGDEKISISDFTGVIEKNIDGYLNVHSLEKEGSELLNDVGDYFKRNWDSLKDEHAAARAKGEAAEAQWWGEKTGRAVFEIASTVNAAGDVLKAGKALAGLTAVVSEGAELIEGAAELSKIEAAVSEITNAATAVHGNAELATSSASDLRAAEAELIELQKRVPENSATASKITEARAAIDRAERDIATPRPKGPAYGTGDATVNLSNKESGFLNDLQNIGDDVFYRGTTVSEANIAALTRSTGNEFAVFKNANNELRIIRGDAHGINIDPQLKAELIRDGYKLELHSQTGYSLHELEASSEDQALLRDFGQTSSKIVNSNGDISTFDLDSTSTSIVENITSTQNLNATQFDQIADSLDANTKYIVRDNTVTTADGSNFTEYTYVTDSKGDLKRIEGQLKRVTNRPAVRPNAGLQTQIGNEGVQSIPGNASLPANERDVGFHLLGDQFGGGINRANVVPGNAKLNGGTRGGWGYLENRFTEIINNDPNTNIKFSIEVERGTEEIETRPSHFVYKYSLNGGPEFESRYANTLPIPGVTGQPLIS